MGPGLDERAQVPIRGESSVRRQRGLGGASEPENPLHSLYFMFLLVLLDVRVRDNQGGP